MSDKDHSVYQVSSMGLTNPPVLPFTGGARDLVRVLQRHRNAVVAVYRHEGINRIVKAASSPLWADAISNEIACL